MNYWQKAIKHKLFYFVLVTTVLHTCFFAVAKAQSFAFQDERKRDAISFTLIKNLIIIPVYINNKGPFNFILDTGVGPMVITDPKLKDSLQLTYPRQVKVSGFGTGEEVFAYVAKISTATIEGTVAKNVSTFVLTEDLFRLSSYVGKEISGLIGYDFFNSFTVKINYPSKRLAISIPNDKARVKGEKIPIELIGDKPYVMATLQSEAYGKINVKLIVDCGASHALSLETYNEKIFHPPAVNIRGNLGMGLTGVISGHIARTPTLAIGPFLFKNVLTNFPIYDDVGAKVYFKERNGNLGAEVLSRFHVTFDYKNRAMYLQKNAFYRRPFEHDMSGMEIYGGEYPRNYILGRIEPDSPAEKAGLQVNDQIIGINFKHVDTYTLDEVNELFRSENGKTLLIEIVRDQKVFIKLLRLKKRI